MAHAEFLSEWSHMRDHCTAEQHICQVTDWRAGGQDAAHPTHDPGGPAVLRRQEREAAVDGVDGAYAGLWTPALTEAGSWQHPCGHLCAWIVFSGHVMHSIFFSEGLDSVSYVLVARGAGRGPIFIMPPVHACGREGEKKGNAQIHHVCQLLRP